jgi:antitoxin (DNA-binding transcriptional repressor) of toxin-antitoxin stability system
LTDREENLYYYDLKYLWIMSEAIPIKNATCNLEELIKRLSLGESITLIGPEGSPVALLVSLKPEKAERRLASDWDARMDDLARKVSCAWKGEKSAVESLSEMRR